MNDKALPTLPNKPMSERDQSPNAVVEEVAANIDQAKIPKDEKKAARWAFHIFNFGALHVAFNSTVSLFIAYNILPTKFAKSLKETLGKIATPINAALYKVTTPIKKFIQGSAFKEISKEQMEINIAHSARSRVETGLMCIAGFFALWPVKYLEDHRAGFINTVDNFFHPGRSKAERAALALKPDDEPKETWTNLIRARFVGLGVVFGVDALQQRFNNALGYEKGNVDTAVWKWGAKASEKISPSWRSRIVNFFSRKGINLGSIQPDMRDYLLKAINSPELHDLSKEIGKIQEQMGKTTDKAVLERLGKEIERVSDTFKNSNPHLVPKIERAIFAEQSRLLITKELFLTLVVSATIYTAAKAPFMARFFEKIGLKKKELTEEKSELNHKDAVKDMPPQSTPEPIQETNHADAIQSRKSVVVPSKEPPELFAAKYSAKKSEDWQASVTKTEAESPSLSQAV